MHCLTSQMTMARVTIDVIVSTFPCLLYLHYSTTSTIVWSNFEVGDLDFFRSKAYLDFFTHLDNTGKFFYERWGDAPVHSIGVALLLPASQIHYFEDIGYYHGPFWNCPRGELHEKLKCKCTEASGFDAHGSGCMQKFNALFPDGSRG
jgi:hypothetical protein